MNELESGVPPLKLCRQISGQLSELLNCPVVCKYDESENLFYAQIFDVVFDRFDEVEAKVSDYSNANYERLGAFCIPVIFTPEQTRDCFPMYAELEAERDQFRKVAEKLVWLYSDEHQERLDNGLRIDGFHSHEWLSMILDMARKALEGEIKL